MNTREKATVLLALVISTLTVVAPVAASGDLRTVALSGNVAPGTGEGVNFKVLFGPALNNHGETAFQASLSGNGVNNANGSGVFSEGGGNELTLIARQGNFTLTNNQPIAINFFANVPKISDNGLVSFEGFVGDQINFSNDAAIFRSTVSNEVELVARQGDPAPINTSNVNYSNGIGAGNVVLNGLGQIAFGKFLKGAGVSNLNDSGIFSDAAGSGVAVVARAGELVPGVGSGVQLGGSGNPVINSQGEITFSSQLTGPAVTESSDSAFVRSGANTGITLVAREGDAAQGAGDGVKYGELFGTTFYSAPRINNHGQIAYQASLTGTGVNHSNDRGIFSGGRDSGPTLVARTGETVPGTGGGISFSTFHNPVLDNHGNTAFSAELAGLGLDSSNDSGLFRATSDQQLSLVAREGDPAPGIGTGVNFGAFDITPMINARGQMAFLASLTGPAVDETNDRGIFAENGNGEFQLIARKGDLLDVSDNLLLPELRQISSLFAYLANTSNEDGRTSGFNNLGQLAFSARFTDGSRGIFVSNQVAVPEPDSRLLLWTIIFVRGLLKNRFCIE